MKKQYIFLLLCYLVSVECYSQDTTKTHSFEYSTKNILSGRLGVGVNKSYYIEAGLSIAKYVFASGQAASIFYASYEQNLTEKSNGFSIGYEISTLGLAFGLNTKYETYNKNDYFIITPRIGLGSLGWNIFYGRNISNSNLPDYVSINQLSIVLNINKYIFKGNYPKEQK